MPHTANLSPQPTWPGSGRLARLSEDPAALFVYGTLQFPDVLFTLIDRVPAREPATITGWRAARLPEVPFPGLTQADRGTAQGYLLTSLNPEEWQVLDAFEDAFYELRKLSLDDGRQGWAYTCNPDIADGGHDWSAEEFKRDQLFRYVESCREWRLGYEKSRQQDRIQPATK